MLIAAFTIEVRFQHRPPLTHWALQENIGAGEKPSDTQLVPPSMAPATGIAPKGAPKAPLLLDLPQGAATSLQGTHCPLRGTAHLPSSTEGLTTAPPMLWSRETSPRLFPELLLHCGWNHSSHLCSEPKSHLALSTTLLSWGENG